MSKKKTGTFAMLRILQKYSDSEHVMSTKDITKRLYYDYGIELERRTLYDNFNVLESFGYPIHRYESGVLGYYLTERKFSREQVLRVNTSLRLNPEISDEERRVIIDKMTEDYSDYMKAELLAKIN